MKDQKILIAGTGGVNSVCAKVEEIKAEFPDLIVVDTSTSEGKDLMHKLIESERTFPIKPPRPEIEELKEQVRIEYADSDDMRISKHFNQRKQQYVDLTKRKSRRKQAKLSRKQNRRK